MTFSMKLYIHESQSIDSDISPVPHFLSLLPVCGVYYLCLHVCIYFFSHAVKRKWLKGALQRAAKKSLPSSVESYKVNLPMDQPVFLEVYSTSPDLLNENLSHGRQGICIKNKILKQFLSILKSKEWLSFILYSFICLFNKHLLLLKVSTRRYKQE